MVPVAEAALPGLEDVEGGALLEVGDPLGPLGALRLRHRLEQDLHADVVAPGLVVGGHPVLVREALGEGLRGGHCEAVVPEALPVPGQGVEAGRPERHCVHHAAREREREAVLAVLLEERGLVAAGEVDVDEVGLGLADLQDIGAVVRGIGGHHLVGHHGAAVLGEKARGDTEEIVAEGVVRRQADRLRVHGVAALDVEHVPVAVLAAQLVGVGAGVDVGNLVAVRLLGDGQRGGRADLAEQAQHLVAFHQLLHLGHGHAGVDAVLSDQLDLAAEHTPAGIGLLDSHRCRLEAVIPELPQEAGTRGQMTHAQRLGLPLHDGREAERAYGRCARAGRRSQEGAPAEPGVVIPLASHESPHDPVRYPRSTM